MQTGEHFTARRVNGIRLNCLCLAEEERKSHFLNTGRSASGPVGLFSHPSFNTTSTLLKWDHVLYHGDPLFHSVTNQKPVKKQSLDCSSAAKLDSHHNYFLC